MVELLEKQGNKVKFKVVVPVNEVNSAFDGVYNAVSRQVKVPGFRSGKIPKSVLEKRVGLDYIVGEVRDHLVETTYPKAVKELDLRLVSAKVTPGDLNQNTDFEFTVEADNYPEVILPDWEKFTIETKESTVGDADVDNALLRLQSDRASFNNVKRNIQISDLVHVEVLEGEDVGSNYPVYLERADEKLKTALIDKLVGDEVVIKFEEDDTPVKLRVLEIKERILPELNDDFAKQLKLESLDQLRENILSDLKRITKEQTEGLRRQEFVDKLVEGMTVDIPQAMIDSARHEIETNLERDLQKQGLNLAEYRKHLESQGKLSGFEDELTKSSDKRVRRDIAVDKLVKTLGVKLSDEEWTNVLNNSARSNGVTLNRLVELLGDKGLSNLLVMAVESKTLDEALSKIA